jgi:hypothetical protein
VEVTRETGRTYWGRDRDGTVWMGLDAHRGIRIEPNEYGPWLKRSCDMFGLQPESVLGELLGDCHLQTVPEASNPMVRVIRARPIHPPLPPPEPSEVSKRHERGPRRRSLVEATVELDAETKVIRRLKMTRQSFDGGLSTVTFTLVDTRTADEVQYHLEGHLTEPYEILDREDDPDKRREALASWMPGGAERWLRDRNGRSESPPAPSLPAQE